jgi:hypothetical protein
MLLESLKPLHKTIWVNTLHGYYLVLDPSINNINAQPHHLINEMKFRLEENWEYVGYDLSYREFKAHLNVFLKNRRHGLKLLIETNALKPIDYVVEH